MYTNTALRREIHLALAQNQPISPPPPPPPLPSTLPPSQVVVVADRPEEIADEVRGFSSAYDFVLTTGGVGPTHDDVTIEGR